MIASRVDNAIICAEHLDITSIVASRLNSVSIFAQGVCRAAIEATPEQRAVITASRLCTVSGGSYLIVDADVIWLNEENNYMQDVEVFSNTDWIIE